MLSLTSMTVKVRGAGRHVSFVNVRSAIGKERRWACFSAALLAAYRAWPGAGSTVFSVEIATIRPPPGCCGT
jgi:hypothetical protein